MKFSYILILNLVTCEGALRIIGGRDALRDEFPFAVRLEIEVEEESNGDTNNVMYEQLCTGAALTSEWILSAAHCYFKGYKIVARYNSHFPKDMGQISPILKIFIHPQFLLDSAYILFAQNDLALFQSKNISVSRYGKISAVDYKTLLGHEVNILGFGGTNATDLEKPLQVLNGMINNCLKREIDSGEIAIAPMCVVPSCRVEATICGGDSGGPVVHPSGIVGVNSMAINDCNESTTNLRIVPETSASIVAAASHALDWISKIISNKFTH